MPTDTPGPAEPFPPPLSAEEIGGWHVDYTTGKLTLAAKFAKQAIAILRAYPQALAAVERLQRGELTNEEIQRLCHNLHERCARCGMLRSEHDDDGGKNKLGVPMLHCQDCAGTYEPPACTPERFCDGCEAFQVQLFGRSPIASLRQELAAAKSAVTDAMAEAGKADNETLLMREQRDEARKQLAAVTAERDQLAAAQAERDLLHKIATCQLDKLIHVLGHDPSELEPGKSARDCRIIDAFNSRYALKAANEQLAAAQAACGEMRAKVSTLRRYVAVEDKTDGVIGLAYRGSIMGPCYNPTYEPMELLEVIEKWLHAKCDDILSTDAGKGWVSPEEHAKVQAERDAAMQENVRLWDRTRRLEEALRKSLDVIEGLAGQQAMSDDWYRPHVAEARKLLEEKRG